jgi:hypothetical protein
MVSFMKVALGLVLLMGGLIIGLSEWGEVVVIRPLGVESAEETRLWVVDLPDGVFVRGSSGKAWTENAVGAGSVALRRDGVWANYTVTDVSGQQTQHRVNVAMRKKYGFSDRFIGWTEDFSLSWPLRLDPAP